MPWLPKRGDTTRRVPEPHPYYSHKQLLEAWEEFQKMDPVDAANDAEYLARLCEQRASDVALRHREELRAVGDAKLMKILGFGSE